MSSVLVWILYDIVDDKARARVAKECKKYGLIRGTEKRFSGQIENQPV